MPALMSRAASAAAAAKENQRKNNSKEDSPKLRRIAVRGGDKGRALPFKISPLLLVQQGNCCRGMTLQQQHLLVLPDDRDWCQFFFFFVFFGSVLSLVTCISPPHHSNPSRVRGAVAVIINLSV